MTERETGIIKVVGKQFNISIVLCSKIDSLRQFSITFNAHYFWSWAIYKLIYANSY